MEFLNKGCDAGLNVSMNKGRETRTEVHIPTHNLRIDCTCREGVSAMDEAGVATVLIHLYVQKTFHLCQLPFVPFKGHKL